MPSEVIRDMSWNHNNIRIQYDAIQYEEIQCKAIRYDGNTMQYGTIRYDPVKCDILWTETRLTGLSAIIRSILWIETRLTGMDGIVISIPWIETSSKVDRMAYCRVIEREMRPTVVRLIEWRTALEGDRERDTTVARMIEWHTVVYSNRVTCYSTKGDTKAYCIGGR